MNENGDGLDVASYEVREPVAEYGEPREFGFRKILAWQKSADLATLCYEVTQGFPKGELFGMTSQIRRAAVSIAANIAEGWARRSDRDFIRFIDIALGSLAELESHIEISQRVGLLSEHECERLRECASEVSRVTYGFRRSLVARSSESS